MNDDCEQIVTAIATAIDAEPAETTMVMKLSDGQVVGQQIQIDATEKNGLLNRCRLSIFNVNLSPHGEAARMEFEQEKTGKLGKRIVYSVQSIRRVEDKLIIMENFIAEGSSTVRDEDFRAMTSEGYVQNAILKSLKDWILYRAWQLQEAKKK